MKIKPFLKALTALVIILVLVFVYIGQFPHFNLLLTPKRLLLYATIIGLATGILFGKHFSQNEWELFEKVRIYVIFIVTALVFMPLFLSLANRYLDFRNPDFIEAELVSHRQLVHQPFGYVKGEELKVTGYKTGVILDKKVFTFQTKENPFPGREIGSKVSVPIYRGALGIRYIEF